MDRFNDYYDHKPSTIIEESEKVTISLSEAQKLHKKILVENLVAMGLDYTSFYYFPYDCVSKELDDDEIIKWLNNPSNQETMKLIYQKKNEELNALKKW